MAAILISAILNLAILESAISVFPLKLTHTCQDWFPPFAQKNLHSFILTQLHDDSYLEFCHLGFGHLGICHLSLSFQTHTHLPRLVPTICTKTNFTHISLPTICTKKKLPSFILSELDNGHHLELCHVGFRHWHLGFRYIVIFSQIHSIHSPSNLTLTQTNSIWLKLIHSHLIDDGSHLEFCHLGFSFCIVEFRHLVFFSQIHSKTLSLHSDSDSN